MYEECLRKAAVPTLLIYLPTNHPQVHAGGLFFLVVGSSCCDIFQTYHKVKSERGLPQAVPPPQVVHRSTSFITGQLLVRIDVDLAVNSKVLRWTRGYPGENTAEGECRECKAVCLPPSLPPNSPSQPPLTPPTYPSTLPPPNTTHPLECGLFTLYLYVKYSHIC